jgi:hypothetical protein
MNERRAPMPRELRACFKWDGKQWLPKRVFTSEELAEDFALTLLENLKPYQCIYHGWHLGH